MIKAQLISLFFIIHVLFPPTLQGVSVGSKSALSSQSLIRFLSTDTNNRILGFTALEGGFLLEDNTTSCTFDAYMPVSGLVDLRGGVLVLKKDFTLSNTESSITGGVILANNHALFLPRSVQDFSLPTNPCFFIQNDGVMQMGSTVQSVDWSLSDSYFAASSSTAGSDTELKIGYFSGSTVTTTLTQELGTLGVNVNAVAWHPTKRYLAVATSSLVLNVLIYEHRVHNGTLAQLSSTLLSATGLVLAWHPSGAYLVAGFTGGALNNEIVTYAVSTSGVIGASTTINLSPAQNVLGLSFAPGGNKLAVGTASNTTTNVSELYIYGFSGGSLTLTSSLDAGATINSVDWNPTGTFVAAALSGNANSIRMYDTSATQVKEVASARLNIGLDCNSVHWDKTGTYLLVGGTNGSAGKVYIFQWDSVAKTLTQIYDRSTDLVSNAARWSRSGSYFAYAGGIGSTNEVFVYQAASSSICPLRFDRATVVCKNDVIVTGPVKFSNTCKINALGNRIAFASDGQLIGLPGSSLVIEDAWLYNVGGSQLRCLTNTSSITLRNCIISLDGDYTFSQGSLLFDLDNKIIGTNKFIYTSALGSTIASNSKLYFGDGITFSYAPVRPNQNLIFMTDKTSQLYLDSCTLHSTRTGLRLSGGTLVIDDKVTMSSEGKNTAEALWLDANLDVVVRSGAQADFYGVIKYQ